jgi:hypothetical protein
VPRRRGGEDEPANDRRPHQRDLLGNEAADGETEQVGVVKLHGGEERDRVAGHLLDGVRGGSGGTADSGVVEGHDPPGRRQRVDQRRIPVVQVPAEVLEQDQRHRALPAAGVTVGIVDAVSGSNQLVGKLSI